MLKGMDWFSLALAEVLMLDAIIPCNLGLGA